MTFHVSMRRKMVKFNICFCQIPDLIFSTLENVTYATDTKPATRRTNIYGVYIHIVYTVTYKRAHINK